MNRRAVPTRTMLRSFWLTQSIGLGVLATAAAWISGAADPAWGIVLALAIALPGWWRPSLVRAPYRAWDRLGDLAARAARLWLTGVCFLIVTIVGLAGSRLVWRGSGTETGWKPKHRAHDPPRSLRSWARRPGNGWVWALIPALLLLMAVEGTERSSLGGDVYTLY